jgi:hypothetical protein
MPITIKHGADPALLGSLAYRTGQSKATTQGHDQRSRQFTDLANIINQTVEGRSRRQYREGIQERQDRQFQYGVYRDAMGREDKERARQDLFTKESNKMSGAQLSEISGQLAQAQMSDRKDADNWRARLKQLRATALTPGQLREGYATLATDLERLGIMQQIIKPLTKDQKFDQTVVERDGRQFALGMRNGEQTVTLIPDPKTEKDDEFLKAFEIILRQKELGLKDGEVLNYGAAAKETAALMRAMAMFKESLKGGVESQSAAIPMLNTLFPNLDQAPVGVPSPIMPDGQAPSPPATQQQQIGPRRATIKKKPGVPEEISRLGMWKKRLDKMSAKIAKPIAEMNVKEKKTLRSDLDMFLREIMESEEAVQLSAEEMELAEQVMAIYKQAGDL